MSSRGLGGRRATFSQFLLLDDASRIACEEATRDILAAGRPPVGTRVAIVDGWRPGRKATAASFLSNASALPAFGLVSSSSWHPGSFHQHSGAAEHPDTGEHPGAGDHPGAGEHPDAGAIASAAVGGHPRLIDMVGILWFIVISGAVGAGYKKLFNARKAPKDEDDKDTEINSGLASNMLLSVSELSNEALMTLAEQGVTSACTERLIRHIMNVDNVSYKSAKKRMLIMDAAAVDLIDTAFWPYTLMIGMCMVSGATAVPMTYSKTLAELTNYLFVHSSAPEPTDLQNMWQVSSWSWDWMEPLMGTAAFVILCIQLARGLNEDMEMLVYHQRVKIKAGKEICALYPQYDSRVVMSFVKTLNLASVDEEAFEG